MFEITSIWVQAPPDRVRDFHPDPHPPHNHTTPRQHGPNQPHTQPPPHPKPTTLGPMDGRKDGNKRQNPWKTLPPAPTLTPGRNINALGKAFCPSAINGAWPAPVWDAMNGAQTGEDEGMEEDQLGVKERPKPRPIEPNTTTQHPTYHA